MPVNSVGGFDLRDLAHLLRKERLFVNSELDNVEQLTAQVCALSSTVTQHTWVAAQQRRNLHQLVLVRQDCQPALQKQRGYSIERLRFLDAGPVLGYSETAAYGNFLAALRNSPELLASCLTAFDSSQPERVAAIINALSAGVFGSCLVSADKRIVLRLLRQLAHLQLAPSDNPRRLLRHGTCAFSRFYSTFHENLHTAQLYLTAALHGPIMNLLAEDEEFLVVDPEQSSPWSPPVSLEAANCEQQRDKNFSALVSVTEQFVAGLKDKLFCFPPSVSWLLRQLVSMLTKAGFLQEREIYELCTDLLLTHFICPAIVNPEPHGIIEAPVSRAARSNLIQVAKILQTLAMSKYEGGDLKMHELYSHFNPSCVSRIISIIIDGGEDFIESPVEVGDLEGISRATALLTQSQLNSLVSFLQTVLDNNTGESVDRQQLQKLLANVPVSATNGHKSTVKPRVPDTVKKTGLLAKGLAKARPNSNGIAGDEVVVEEEVVEPVLVFRLPGEMEEEILTEAKVMEMQRKIEVAPTHCVIDGPDIQDSADTSQSQEKRTRFSLSHDEGSIGNTSDNLEAISEAASNHSGASSLESEHDDQNDNLSDMVSANVSGRGSPNISGRDTPSSQITEGEAVDRPAPVPRPVTKQSRSEIEDKFCKFEIKKQDVVGDETVSLVSDTWSTDVLASDSETLPDASAERFPRPPDDGPPHPFIQHSLDISETASEAWSTDVMASDSERLTEVDTDDTASVAPSDDTAASEPGGRGDEPDTPPPLLFRAAARDYVDAGSSGLFQPIGRLPRLDDTETPRVSLTVPPSPTRVSDPSYAYHNVTGRGGAKSDYKRRTLEFVGSVTKPPSLATLESPRMIHVIDKMDGGGRGWVGRGGGKPPIRSHHTGPPAAPSEESADIETGMSALSLTPAVDPATTRPAVNPPEAVNLIAFDEPPPTPSSSSSFKPSTSGYGSAPVFSENKSKSEGEDVVFRSSTSLASSSSSGSAAAGLTPASASAESKITATVTIPKSISFDKTADKDFLDDKKHNKKGFFGNLKMSFKNRKLKKGEGYESEGPGMRVRRVMSEDSKIHNRGSVEMEDILAKYRGKGGEERETRPKRSGVTQDVEETQGLSEEGIFLNAKRKLRIVFARADLTSWPASVVRESELVSFLQLQLAEARSLQNRDLVSQLHETLRCVRLFDDDGCRRLVAALRNDLAARASYSAYVTSVRQMLLSRVAHLTRLNSRIEVESRLTESFLISLCVRLFLERREEIFRRFTQEFRDLSLADEKTDLLDAFLAEISDEMDSDPVWQGASEEQRSEAEAAIRTLVLSRVYPYAFYPNGDGDISRDQVLYDHIKKLAAIITPNHKDLQIPLRYHGECPWPSAQAELTALVSYKTPRDKVACVVRCAETIMNLLALASEGVPAADEFLPVLVYVILSANPRGLLSTVQYVESFYRDLSGADLYYWTQFCSAIELIKTMEYGV